MGAPTFRSRLPIRRSDAAAMAAPPPVQNPFSAAMVGTRQDSMVVSTASIIAS